MPALRERFRRKIVKPFHVEQQFDTKWQLSDKKKLLAALRKYDAADLTAIRNEFLPYRSEREIEWFLTRVRVKSSLLTSDSEQTSNIKLNAPIETWKQTAEDLTIHQTDYSYALAQVLSIIGEKEEHDPKLTQYDPDWKSIYNYVLSALRGYELPTVGQIEAAILLDITERLTLHLKALDVSAQRWLMKLKFELLSLRDKCSPEDRQSAARALQEDLIESEPQSCNGSSRPATASVDQSPVPGCTVTLTTSQDTALHTDIVCKIEEGSPVEVKRRRGRKRLSVGDSCRVSRQQLLSSQQKKPLYGLNPFCIPIKYLNPKVRPKGPS